MAEIEPHMKLEMFSQARFLAAARAMISSFAQRLGFNDIDCGQISLAVDEAICNVINHGYDKRADGKIWLLMWAIEGDRPEIKIVIEDRAKQVDPAVIRSRDLDDIRPGGLGVYIIREIMDEVQYQPRDGGGMRLTMRKRMGDGSKSKDRSTPAQAASSKHTRTSSSSGEQQP